MKSLALALALIFAAGTAAQALDATVTCKSQATEKKLAGAALNSFTKKCETDAAAKCDAAATEKKLFGAARTSFTKKCVTDATGG
ncbi:hypothetical protein EYW49_15630 [Siculibacillus lacustris]|uniref:Phosphate starvation-inducible protein PsiF n=1 Tax=Siculibacillus lacustris TaxID=1549641 RepID=A0A4V2KT61_9HYPH|nr:hypothetical protein [Siculibacillus lacustris]TBW35822.1 hypothetical protein EYW49_15630 [Siculibacillus lacustris]